MSTWRPKEKEFSKKLVRLQRASEGHGQSDVPRLLALPDIHHNRKPCRYPRNGKTGPWDRSWEPRGSSKSRRRLLPADELFPRAEQHAKPAGPKACCLS